MSAEAELQKAVFGKLNAGLSVPVYAQGDVPDNEADRYVVIGNDTFVEWETDCLIGFEATLVIHTWDTQADNRSFLPLKEIMGESYNLLHRAELPLISYNAIELSFEFSETFLDPDGLTRHGVQRFRILMRG